VVLCESVHQRLSMYVIAAGAAGVSVLALAQPSEGKIVYTHTNVRLGQHYNLDLNHDGITDFSILDTNGRQRECGGGYLNFALLEMTPSQGNGVVGGVQHFHRYAAALDRNVKIGPKQTFLSTAMGMASVLRGITFSCRHASEITGPWVNVTNRYLGLKFMIKGKTHYGWARLSVKAGFVFVNATLTGYAYETIAGKAIIAGATSGPDDPEPAASLNAPTPEPATLGALAMGAPGLSIWRRKKTQELIGQ
jgi:hypothetical protein